MLMGGRAAAAVGARKTAEMSARATTRTKDKCLMKEECMGAHLGPQGARRFPLRIAAMGQTSGERAEKVNAEKTRMRARCRPRA